MECLVGSNHMQLQDGRWLIVHVVNGFNTFTIAKVGITNRDGIFHYDKVYPGCSHITKKETLHKYGVTDNDVAKILEGVVLA